MYLITAENDDLIVHGGESWRVDDMGSLYIYNQPGQRGKLIAQVAPNRWIAVCDYVVQEDNK